MSYEYYILPKYDSAPVLIHSKDGEAINLKGVDEVKTIPATKNEPSSERTIRGATQKDLKELYEDPKYGNLSRLIGKRKSKKKPVEDPPTESTSNNDGL